MATAGMHNPAIEETYNDCQFILKEGALETESILCNGCFS